MDLNSENIDPASAGTAFVKPAPPVAPAKKVRKRRKSVGPAMLAASDALDASDAEREDSAPFASEADTAPGKPQTEPPPVTQQGPPPITQPEPPPVTQPEPASATHSDLKEESAAHPATAGLSVEAWQIELHVARSEVKRLSFELETALQDNEDLQDQNSELRKQLAHMEASLAHEKEARAAAEADARDMKSIIGAPSNGEDDEDHLQLLMLRNAAASLATLPSAPPSKQAEELPPQSTTLSTCALSNPVAFSARLCGDMAAMTANAPKAPASLAQVSGPAEALAAESAAGHDRRPLCRAAPLAAAPTAAAETLEVVGHRTAEHSASTPVPQSTPRRPRMLGAMTVCIALPSTPGLALLSMSRPPTTLPRDMETPVALWSAAPMTCIPVGVPVPSAELPTEVSTEVAAAKAAAAAEKENKENKENEVEVVAMVASPAAVATGDAAEATLAEAATVTESSSVTAAMAPPPPPSPAAASVAALEATVAPPPPSPAAASAAEAHAPSPSPAVPPPIASPVGAVATRRRARRKSVVSRADLALHQEDVAAEVAAESAAEAAEAAAAAESVSLAEAATVSESSTVTEGATMPTEAEAAAEPDAAAQSVEHVTTPDSAMAPPTADALDAAEASEPSSIQAEAQAEVSAPLPVALPDESTLRSLSSPAEMLSAALEAAIGVTEALGAPDALGLKPAQTEALRALFGALGQIASSQAANAKSSAKQAAAAAAAKKGKGGKAGGSAKNGSSSSSGSSESSGGDGTRSVRSVQFATHDLSSLAPPGRAGSRPQAEAEQEAIVERLAALIHSQWALLPVSPNAKAVDAKAAPSAEAAAMRACLATLQACLEALGSSAALSAELRAASSFYGVELWGWLRRGQPMLWRRLGELLSSSLRLHLSAIFSEEEDAEPDPLLATMRERVREHVAAYGTEAYTTTGTEESFSSVITANLLLIHRHAPTLAPGTAAGAALVAAAADDECAAALHDLPAEIKDSLLAWAHAHSLLQQIFGPREPLGKLMKLPVNVPHFARLSALASVASELESRGSCDEAYLAPLRDIPQLQRDLHMGATLAKVAHETLLVFALNPKRRTTRTKRGDK